MKHMDIYSWYRTSKPGTEVQYYCGFLMSDRETDSRLSAMADVALRLCEDGRVILYQKKLRCGVYLYMAKRTRKK